MDSDAARRARRKAIKEDLAEVYDDDEASPPEWVDLLSRTRAERSDLSALIERAAEDFSREPDIRRALALRENVSEAVRTRAEELNRKIARLNLLVPHPRFSRPAFDVEEAIRALYRIRRDAGGRRRA